MTAMLQHVFADTSFWISLVVRQDQHHARAQQWSQQIAGQITTTIPVLIETANALSKPGWRKHGVKLLDHLQHRPDVEIVQLTADLWQRGCDLYRSRSDKAWSLTDCVSFLVMQDANLSDALTADEDFRQAGFRAVMLDDP